MLKSLVQSLLSLFYAHILQLCFSAGVLLMQSINLSNLNMCVCVIGVLDIKARGEKLQLSS